MKPQLRLLLCTTVLLSALIGMPSIADSPATDAAQEETTMTTTSTSTSSPSDTVDGVEQVSLPSDVKQFFDRMGLKPPKDKTEALGILGAILGLSSTIMLVTGAILPACMKRFDLLKGMLGVGIPCGLISLACPAIVESSGSLRTEVGTALVVFFLVLYMAVFFLPAILAFKDNTPKKWLITVINAAGLVVPAVGLVALFLALKDKPAVKPHSVIG
jgi:hypothetical protein